MTKQFGRGRPNRPLLVACLSVMLVAVAGIRASSGSEPDQGSPELVKQLAAAMADRQLNAIAARDPEEPERYVAAMLYPGVQLLVITARSTEVPYLESRLSSGNYADVYSSLHHGVPETKLFVQDMGCDGLHGAPDRLADIVYERGVDQRILDGDHKAADMSREEYAKLVQTLDGRYTKLLSLLLETVRAPKGDAAARK